MLTDFVMRIIGAMMRCLCSMRATLNGTSIHYLPSAQHPPSADGERACSRCMLAATHGYSSVWLDPYFGMGLNDGALALLSDRRSLAASPFTRKARVSLTDCVSIDSE